MNIQRRSPERLLRQVADEERRSKRGKLKIYFGAAPGVGKTYTMLQDATVKIRQGLDIVVGIAESHGRIEIDNLLNYFEIIPRQSVNYRDRSILEFDLDAVLKRNPAVVLIDEMAHTNAPGLRHSKRWQDIKEILDRGIDVYTTLNVQHIESINNDVEQIIGYKIRETVPDSMIEMADSIELVDLPAQDLLKRLQEGKVYFPLQAEIAKDNFFREDKLTALREIALRITAERVGEQALLYRQDKGVEAIWPSSEKILVCVGPNDDSQKLIRTAKRIATQFKTEWIAVYIDIPKLRSSHEERNKAITHLRLAEQLGAETRIIAGLDPVKEILNCAHEQNVSQIIVGKTIRSRFRNLFHKDFSDELVRNSGEIDVHVITRLQNKSRKIKYTKPPVAWHAYFYAVCMVALTTGFNLILSPTWAQTNVIMVYFLGIIIVALLGRIGPSILVSLLSVISYGYFFITFSYQFMITDLQYFFTLLVMLFIAQIISSLTILTRRQAESSSFTEHQTNILHSLSRRLASTRGVDKILEIGANYIGEVFDSKVIALKPNDIQHAGGFKNPAGIVLNAKEESVAQWVYELGQKAGRGTDTLSFSESLYLPLIASKNAKGVLSITPNKATKNYSPEEMRLLESCAKQIALAIDADRIEDHERQSKLQVAVDEVRNQLLQDISHDIRTPLIAAMGSLRRIAEDEKKFKLNELKTICHESYAELEKLSRLVNNLLQISFLEKTNVVVDKKPISIRELVDGAVAAMAWKLSDREVDISIPNDLPRVTVDSGLITDVIKQFLENTVKFTPTDSMIKITAVCTKQKVTLCLKDDGPGIAEDEKDKLFEKFYRGKKLSTEHGLGLGLAICHKIITAHGGEIWAENNPEGGATFCFSLQADTIKNI